MHTLRPEAHLARADNDASLNNSALAHNGVLLHDGTVHDHRVGPNDNLILDDAAL